MKAFPYSTSGERLPPRASRSVISSRKSTSEVNERNVALGWTRIPTPPPSSMPTLRPVIILFREFVHAVHRVHSEKNTRFAREKRHHKTARIEIAYDPRQRRYPWFGTATAICRGVQPYPAETAVSPWASDGLVILSVTIQVLNRSTQRSLDMEPGRSRY